MTTTDSGGAAGGKLPLEIEAPINAIAMDMPWMPGTATRPLDALRAAILRFANDRAAEARRKALEGAASLCEIKRQKVISDPRDPSWTEHFADLRLEILRCSTTPGASDGR